MNSKPEDSGHGPQRLVSPRSVRLPFFIGALLVGAAGCGALLWFIAGPAATGPAQSRPAAAKAEAETALAAPAPSEPRDQVLSTPERTAARTALVKPTSPKEAAPLPPAAPEAEPSPYTRQLVDSLSVLAIAGGTVTAEQAAEWRGKLQQLVEQGAAGVPAIGEFLRKNTDFDFGDSAGALGYGSARAALFDALLQIGGPQATSVLLQTMQTTAEPREVAVLARELETLAPEQYRQEALSAARQALAMAGSGKLEGADVGPLFELMYKYGGTGVVPELEQAAKQWNYYATIALAQLPDGAGIPALIQIAQGTSAPKGNAVELLAQTAPQYPEARAALLDLARANKIPPSLWPYLTPLLAGGQYRYQDSAFDDSLTEGSRRARESGHVLSGNQHFYTTPDVGSLTPDQINQRMALIDDLRSATSDPVALNALQDSRDRLAKLLPASVATTP